MNSSNLVERAAGDLDAFERELHPPISRPYGPALAPSGRHKAAEDAVQKASFKRPGVASPPALLGRGLRPLLVLQTTRCPSPSGPDTDYCATIQR